MGCGYSGPVDGYKLVWMKSSARTRSNMYAALRRCSAVPGGFQASHSLVATAGADGWQSSPSQTACAD